MKKNKASRATKAANKFLAGGRAEKHFLRLYVAGATARSRQALRRVHQLCELELKNNFTLEVIDVYQQPELARIHQIIATPTLVKESPPPVRRFVGTLANTNTLFGDVK